MKEKRIIRILALLLVTANFFLLQEKTVYAVPESNMISFSAELKLTSEGWGIYGTISQMTDDMTEIVPCFSFDGESYIETAYNSWGLDAADPQMLRQQCFWSNEDPIFSWINGSEKLFFVRLQITYADGATVYTQPELFQHQRIGDLPEDYMISGAYAPTIRMRADLPSKLWGQYCITVPESVTEEELHGLLPSKVPVELTVNKQGEAGVKQVVFFQVQWEDYFAQIKTSDEERIEVKAMEIIPSEEYWINIGMKEYRVSQEQMTQMLLTGFTGIELKATFHLVKENTSGEILFSEGESGIKESGIRATLPLKPSGAKSIYVEYSLDGGHTFTSVRNIQEAYPPDTMLPKEKSYTATILNAEDAPVKQYLSGDIQGFHVRLRIEGGVFSGVTKTEGWPVEYQYIPPNDDSDDIGSGGNENNAGSGSVGGSGENGGQRPNLEESVKSEGEERVQRAEKEAAAAKEQSEAIKKESVLVSAQKKEKTEANGKTKQPAADEEAAMKNHNKDQSNQASVRKEKQQSRAAWAVVLLGIMVLSGCAFYVVRARGK